MKKFYDRVGEMTELRELQHQAYNDYSRFVVLTGRRRVGKTSLVDTGQLLPFLVPLYSQILISY